MSLVNIPRRLFTHDYCPTGKRAHATRAEAMVHLRGLLLSADHRPGVMNVYACTACEQWHVGHMTRREVRIR